MYFGREERDASFVEISAALADNTTLEDLDLNYCTLGKDAVTAIPALMNGNLLKLNLDGGCSNTNEVFAADENPTLVKARTKRRPEAVICFLNVL